MTCSGQPVSLHTQMPIRTLLGVQPRIGNQIVHATHNTTSYLGYLYCRKCGGYTAGRKTEKLGRACTTPTGPGKDFLKAVLKGALPKGIDKH